MLPWIIPAIGALGGALMNKKNPLQGALMGGALGYGAGALPGLLSGGGAAAASGATGAAELGAAELGAAEAAGGLQQAEYMSQAATAGMAHPIGPGYGPESLGTQIKGLLNDYGKPVGTAINAASQVNSMFPQEPTPPAPQVAPPNANPTLANLYQGMQQGQMARQQESMQKRMERMKRIQMMGGGNGFA